MRKTRQSAQDTPTAPMRSHSSPSQRTMPSTTPVVHVVRAKRNTRNVVREDDATVVSSMTTRQASQDQPAAAVPSPSPPVQEAMPSPPPLDVVSLESEKDGSGDVMFDGSGALGFHAGECNCHSCFEGAQRKRALLPLKEGEARSRKGVVPFGEHVCRLLG